ncbi:ribonuclease P protein component [Paenibacillus sp. J23TS9]|nr:ribonuclease P protein component [Paenibacillus sp. J23TS9]
MGRQGIRLHKSLRLRNRADFSRVYRHGKSFANHQFVVYWFRKKEVEKFRVGISVSKKVGNAVVRNRMRRLVKEIVRHQEDRLIEHVDLVFIVRKGALDMPYKDLEKSILHVLRKASLLRPPGR